jgi:hypothetical protein
MATPYPGMDLGGIRGILDQFKPSPEEVAQRRRDALMLFLLGLGNAKRGHEAEAIGRSGLFAYGQMQNNDPNRQLAERMQLAQGALGLSQALQQGQAQRELADIGLRGQGAPSAGPAMPAPGLPAGSVGGSGMGGGTTGLFGGSSQPGPVASAAPPTPQAPSMSDYFAMMAAPYEQAATDPSKSPTTRLQARKIANDYRMEAYKAKLEELKATPFAKINPADYTPESVAAFTQAGATPAATSLLRPRVKMEMAGNIAYNPYAVKEGQYVGPNYGPLGIIPGTGQAYQQEQGSGKINAVGTAPSRVNVSNTTNLPPLESKWQEALGSARAKTYTDLAVEQPRKAAAALNNLNALDDLLRGVETGPATPIGMKAAGIAREFGVEVDPNLNRKQAAQAISNQFALQARNTAEGGGMPGQMSDKDREFLLNSVPNLTQSPEGRQMLIDVQRRMLKRQILAAERAREYVAKHGTLDEGFHGDMQAYADAHPLFADLTAKTPAASGGGWSIKRVQ